MTGALVPPAVSKEIRALLPAWIACAAGVGAVALSGDSAFRLMGLLAYALGCIVLGAQSVGHEYAHRMLSTLLAQPADRRTIFLTKLGVLASMLAVLSAMAWGLLPSSGLAVRPPLWHPATWFLAAVCALFIAPWLTMACRSALAGIVFTITLPMLLVVAGDLLGLATYGLGAAADIDRFKVAFSFVGLVVLCGAGAVSSWRMFLRLEAIDGRGPEIRVPPWWRSGGAQRIPERRVAHPLLSLARKELRLQQLTFVVAALYLLFWASGTILNEVVRGQATIPVGGLSMLYFGVLSILIGSLASAEERQLGTLEWQILMPIAASRQWAVKAAIALGLAVALGAGLPFVLRQVGSTPANINIPIQIWVTGVMLLTTVSLYVSSLSTSGVRALALSFPVIVGANVFVRTVDLSVHRMLIVAFPPPHGMRWPWRWSDELLLLALAAGLLALLLRFARANHRSAERRLSRVASQAAWIGAYLVLASVALRGFGLYLSR